MKATLRDACGLNRMQMRVHPSFRNPIAIAFQLFTMEY